MLPLVYIVAKHIIFDYTIEQGKLPIFYTPLAVLKVIYGFINN